MAEITLLDGGMGQELIHRSGDTPTPLWSTRVMVDRPGLVAEIHRDFTAAGATVATTNTYAILRDRLEGTDVEDAFDKLYARALSEVAGTAPRVAGSIGPIGAVAGPDRP
ncbi:MAG: homocysteine S-methyltransferase family protein, partial [Pseudomonadota bacterium]